MRYSIDTSAILDGWRRDYPPDVFPIIWEKIEYLIDSCELKATEEVLVELERKDDDVYGWARRQDKLFIPIDTRIQIIVARIMNDYPKLVDTRKTRTSADPFVIALAKNNSCTVVTSEKPTNKVNRPNIPDVCSQIGIQTIDLLQLFREQEWVFKTF